MSDILINNGLKRIIQKKKPKNLFKDLQLDIDKQVDRFLKGEKQSSSELALSEFDNVVKSIEEAPEPTALPTQSLDEQSIFDLTNSYQNAISTLRSQIPMRTKQTILGTTKMDPSDTEKASFLRKANIIDNPLSLFDKIDNILHEEVQTLEAVYPDFLNQVRSTIMEKLTDKKDLTEKQEKSLSKILLIPEMRVTPQSQEQQQQQVGQVDISTPLTEAQQVEFK